MKTHRHRIYQRFFKRPLDFTLASLAMLLLSPVFLIIAVLVKIKLGSPVIFKQQRPGLNENIFTMYKFRTMTNEKDTRGKLLPDSKRLTTFGKILRSTSLDELPELLNVLKGEMSIIGPRPLLLKYLPFYSEKERLRHTVRPGLSGLAQINGRNNLKWDDRLLLDVVYVENISFFLDLSIFKNTLLKVLKREGVNIVDQSMLLDLDLERKEQITHRELGVSEIEFYQSQILELLIETYTTNFQISSYEANKICLEKISSLKQYINSNNAFFIGCFNATNLIGFIWLYPHIYLGEKRIHVNQIIVDKTFRKRGIAQKLLTEAEKKANAQRISTIDLFVSEVNKGALNLYEKLGYKIERRYMKKQIKVGK